MERALALASQSLWNSWVPEEAVSVTPGLIRFDSERKVFDALYFGEQGECAGIGGTMKLNLEKTPLADDG
jgi:hypothetical protein